MSRVLHGLLLAVALGAPAQTAAQLDAAAAAYYHAMPALAATTGREYAYDYYARLLLDRENLNEAALPAGYDRETYDATVQRMAALDIELTTRLESGDYGNPASLRGLHEVLIRSSADGTMQPCALFVPPDYDPSHPLPLVVFLHGNTQTESSLLAPPFVETLALQTHSIVIAPLGRGTYDFAGVATTDVYDAVDAVTKSLSIDPRRRYLAGYSMGAFSVFIIAPVRATMWAAILSVSGGIMGHDIPRAMATLKNTPIYMATGTLDDSIPTQYTQRSAHFFANAGAIVSLYVNPGGTHRLVTNFNILQRAWSDMHAGVIHDLAVDYRWNSAPTTINAKAVIF